jgi:hypothetical protein
MGLRGTETLQRFLASTVTTTNCAKERGDPYSRRIEIVYDYLIDFPTGALNQDQELAASLTGVGNAVAYGLAAVLNRCGADGAPVYAVELASWHDVLESGKVKSERTLRTLTDALRSLLSLVTFSVLL